jgi:hypothetical protein
MYMLFIFNFRNIKKKKITAPSSKSLDRTLSRGGIQRFFKRGGTTIKGAAPRFPSEDKERLLPEILRSCRN